MVNQKDTTGKDGDDSWPTPRREEEGKGEKEGWCAGDAKQRGGGKGRRRRA
jgi:hypothetical protein